MARTPSKILSLAEKKNAEAGLKSVLKTITALMNDSEATLTAANKALVEAKKKADVLAKVAVKAHEVALKDGGKLIAAAQKEVDAATKKHTKVFDAATKGKEKINGQLAALAAAPVAGKTKAVPATNEA